MNVQKVIILKELNVYNVIAVVRHVKSILVIVKVVIWKKF